MRQKRKRVSSTSELAKGAGVVTKSGRERLKLHLLSLLFWIVGGDQPVCVACSGTL